MTQTILEVKDSFVDLERHRLWLEESVSKLRKSLQYWHTWEAEYEGMKEEIEGLDDEYTGTELEQVANESAGTLLNEKEVKLLLIDDKGQHRGSSQIIGLLSRRIEYVQQNVKTVASLLIAAEEKLVASTVLSRPGIQNEEGLPLTEIREELDEEGNVISGSTSAPGNAAPQVIEALRKAGVKELPDTPELNTKSELDFVDKDQPCVTEESSKAPANSILKAPKMQESDGLSCLSGDSSNEGKEPKPSSPRKSVTFAKGTKLADANYSKPKQATSRRALKTINEIKRRAGLADIHSIKPNTPSKDKSKKHSSIEKANRIGHDVSGQLVQEREDDADHDSPRNDNEDTPTTLSKRTISTAATPCYPSSQPASQDEDVSLEHVSNDTAADRDADSEPPIIPADESPEDATLRLQMLEYSMNEVGAVVAEIELDEDDENDSDASYTDEEDEATSDASSAEEDEDDFGRTKRRVLDDVYLEEMRALEKKLNATAIHNVGPQGSTAVPITTGNLNGTMAIEDPLQDVSTLHTIRSVPKGARFAEELDVQTAPPMGQKIDTIKPLPRPVKDTIIKRTTPASVFTEPKAELKKRTSRFKSARTAGLTSSQSNTENVKPVAERVMERTTPGTSSPRQPTSTPNQLPNPATSPTENRTRITPSGPPNRPHNPTVIERPYSGKADLSTALEPDEFDPTLIHQQVVTEYHQMRNRIIQRQGGFLTTDKEKEEVPLTEEEGGAPKVSIFKAARLARLG